MYVANLLSKKPVQLVIDTDLDVASARALKSARQQYIPTLHLQAHKCSEASSGLEKAMPFLRD